MRRLRRQLFSLTVLFFFTVAGVIAQVTPPVSATGHITAEVIPIFSASETSQMNFGRFSPGPSGGKVIITPQGTVSVMGSVVSGSGIHNAASFYITGDTFTSFSITLPKSSVALTNISNAKTMLVTNWLSVPSTGPGGGTLKDGFMTVFIGATLEVGTINDNPVGIYTGTYVLTFEFN